MPSYRRLVLGSAFSNQQQRRSRFGDGWSADSGACFLSWSSEGQSASSHARLRCWRLRFEENRPRRPVNRAFGQPPLASRVLRLKRCGRGLARSSNSRLVAAEIPPLTICDSYGTIPGVRGSCTRSRHQTVQPAGGQEKIFGLTLVPRLRQAPDGCITNPKLVRLAIIMQPPTKRHQGRLLVATLSFLGSTLPRWWRRRS